MSGKDTFLNPGKFPKIRKITIGQKNSGIFCFCSIKFFHFQIKILKVLLEKDLCKAHPKDGNKI